MQALIAVRLNFAADPEFDDEIDNRLHPLSPVLDGIGGPHAFLVREDF